MVSVVRSVVRNVIRNPNRSFVPVNLLNMPLISDLSITEGVGPAVFTRSTTGTFVDQGDGLVKTAAIDVARFESSGVLIEGANTNDILRSEEFDNASWSKSSVTVTPNTAVAPDGTTTADELDLSADVGARIFQSVTSRPAGMFTFSVYLKAKPGQSGTFPVRMLTLGTGGETADALFTLNDSTWVRVELTASQTGVGTVIVYPGNRQVAGETLDTALAWGAQLELSAFASSYIPTTSAAVTKTLDDLSVSAANIVAPASDYSLHTIVDVIGLDSAKSQILLNVDGETTRRLAINTTTGLIEATHGAVTSVSTTAITPGTPMEITFVVDGTNQTLYIDKVQEDQDAKGTVTGAKTRISLGNNAGADQVFANFKPIKIFDTALSNAEQAAL